MASTSCSFGTAPVFLVASTSFVVQAPGVLVASICFLGTRLVFVGKAPGVLMDSLCCFEKSFRFVGGFGFVFKKIVMFLHNTVCFC